MMDKVLDLVPNCGTFTNYTRRNLSKPTLFVRCTYYNIHKYIYIWHSLRSE